TRTPTQDGECSRSHVACLPIDTATALSASLASSVEGQAATFIVSVTARMGSVVPSGLVAFSVDGRDAGTRALDAAGTVVLAITFADDGDHTVAAGYLGAPGFAPSASRPLVHAVTNAAPQVGPLALATDPVAVGTERALAAPFTDAGTADTHTATVDWGDGVTTPAQVQESMGSGTLTASHAYTSAGVYRVTAQVVDDDGGSGTATLDAVVVFDP